MEGDLIISRSMLYPDFNTSPFHGGRPAAQVPLRSPLPRISTPLPFMEGDGTTTFALPGDPADFNTSPFHGGRLTDPDYAGAIIDFNTSPFHGGRHARAALAEASQYFNTSPFHGGRHYVREDDTVYVISTPLPFMEGDTAFGSLRLCAKISTPLPFMEGDLVGASPAEIKADKFQHLSLSWRETANIYKKIAFYNVWPNNYVDYYFYMNIQSPKCCKSQFSIFAIMHKCNVQFLREHLGKTMFTPCSRQIITHPQQLHEVGTFFTPLGALRQ